MSARSAATRTRRVPAFDAGRTARRERLRRFLENEAWPTIPDEVRKRPLTKEERERILGYGPDGV